MTSILHSEKIRNYVLQAAVLVVVVGILVFFVITAQQNLAAQGITSGFDFLFRSTGWDISFSLMDYTVRDPYWRALLIGFENTLIVGLLGLFFATIFGTLIGIARVTPNPLLRALGTIYVEIFRNVPLILQGLFWYAVATHLPHPKRAIMLGDSIFISGRGINMPFVEMSHGTFLFSLSCLLIAGLVIIFTPKLGLFRSSRSRSYFRWIALAVAAALACAAIYTNHDPDVGLFTSPELRGFRFVGGIQIPPEFLALLVAITFFGSGYIAEIVRGGLLSVNKGTLEAAEALGLRPWEVYWYVRIPLALRAVMPPMGNQFVWLMKATTIGIAIGFSDLFAISSTSINQSGQSLEILFIMMAGFLLINYTIGSIMNAINRAIAIKGFDTNKK